MNYEDYLDAMGKIDVGELITADFPLYDDHTISIKDSEDLIKFAINREIDKLFEETGASKVTEINLMDL